MTDNQRTIAGRYQLGALIGRGGMADVYEGTDTRLGRIVAIKLLKADLANDPNFESRFRQEAQASARMAHPTIVRIYDAGEEITTDQNGGEVRRPYIVMEYVKGTLLRDLLHQRRLTIEEAIDYAEGVLTALEISHHGGIIHRDIKSANVMITDAGAVKVMDFGIARAISDSSSTQAHTSGILGTAQYFSPEQARGENVDARTDLYSTGVLLYEMLAGRPPFKGETAVSVAYQHVSEAVTPPSEHNPAIPPELDAVVLQALAKDRNQRFQSAVEFRDHLRAAVVSVRTGAINKPADPLSEFEALLRGDEPNDQADTQPQQPVVSPNQETSVIPPVATELLETNTGTAAANLDGATALLTNPFEELGVDFGAPSPATTAINTESLRTRPARSSAMPSPRVLWGVGTGLSVVIVGLVVWFLTLGSFNFNITPGPSGVEVANVVGQTYDNGYNTLVGQQLGVNKVYQTSDTVPADTIISTDPPAGQRVGEHTTITVYVSSGAIMVSVPDLVGKSEADATAQLTIAKLALGTITPANSPTIPEGMIISSDPPIGTQVKGGSLVNLVVSNGKVMVPDVRNLDLSVAQAKMSAVDVGFTVSVAYPDGCQTPGTLVVDQSVLPGLAPQKSAVVLTVNCNQ